MRYYRREIGGFLGESLSNLVLWLGILILILCVVLAGCTVKMVLKFYCGLDLRSSMITLSSDWTYWCLILMVCLKCFLVYLKLKLLSSWKLFYFFNWSSLGLRSYLIYRTNLLLRDGSLAVCCNAERCMSGWFLAYLKDSILFRR